MPGPHHNQHHQLILQVGLCKGALFIVFQCLGATAGAAILRGVVPDSVRGAAGLGCTGVSGDISVGQVGRRWGWLVWWLVGYDVSII